jgi:hypothetical protein
MTKDGLRKPNYWGSLTQAATLRVGNYEGEEVRWGQRLRFGSPAAAFPPPRPKPQGPQAVQLDLHCWGPARQPGVHSRGGMRMRAFVGAGTHGGVRMHGADPRARAAPLQVHTPFKSLLPMVSPDDMVIGGWDISGMNMAEAMERAAVLDFELQKQLVPLMKDMTPLPGARRDPPTRAAAARPPHPRQRAPGAPRAVAALGRSRRAAQCCG